MGTFRDHYAAVFETFGYPLTANAATPAGAIDAAGRRLGVAVPAALRDYYLVAGRERRFNRCLNRLLPPSEWVVEGKRLLFMEENQSVVRWGVSVRNPGSDDPPVSAAVDGDPVVWAPEHRKCSVFLAVLLHYHAVMGGFRFRGRADAPDQTDYRLEEHGWRGFGEVRSMLAYSRANQVVCLEPPSGLPFAQKWSILAGGKTRRDLQLIADELAVTFA